MSRPAAPGTSLNAQLREGRAQLRRDARKKLEACSNAIAVAEREHRERVGRLEMERLTAEDELLALEDRLRGRIKPENVEVVVQAGDTAIVVHPA